MKRLVPLLLLAALAACGDKPPTTTEIQAEADIVQPGVVCRVGKDGAPLLADRGIGGTGVSFGDHLVDRGIGGTGIVGVVTGFASICVNGLEVRYGSATPVDVDGSPATMDRLRVGQVVAIRAVDPTGNASLPSFARVITVRTEVAGPIEAVEVGSNVMTIAGQRVIVGSTTWGASRFGLGDWTAVSGLRQIDGTIAASRLDDGPADRLFLRGEVSRHDGAFWIGGLRLAGPPAASLRQGQAVTVSGTYQSGQAQLATVTPDTMAANPTGYFGGAVNHLVLQAFVAVDGATIWLNNRVEVAAAPSLRQGRPMSGDAIVSLERQPDGSFLATALRYTKLPATTDAVALAHVWHVRSGPSLPLPPTPPDVLSPDVLTPDEPSAGSQDGAPREPSAMPSSAGPSRAEPGSDGAPGAGAGHEASGALMSCSNCAPDWLMRDRLMRDRTMQDRRMRDRRVAHAAHAMLASARALGHGSIPASVAVFTVTSPVPPKPGDTPAGH